MTFGEVYALIVACVAAFGAADLLVNQGGPGNILARIRVRVGAQARSDGSRRPPARFLGGVLACIYCTGFWTALVFGLYASVIAATTDNKAALAIIPVSPLAGYAVLVVMAGRVTTTNALKRLADLEEYDAQRAQLLAGLSSRVVELYREHDQLREDWEPVLTGLLNEDDWIDLYPLGIYKPGAPARARERGRWLTAAIAADPTPGRPAAPMPDPALGSGGIGYRPPMPEDPPAEPACWACGGVGWYSVPWLTFRTNCMTCNADRHITDPRPDFVPPDARESIAGDA